MEKSMHEQARIRQIQENYHRIKASVEDAAVRAGRQPCEVRLMCVTKTVEAAYINAALAEGADLIGENRVQEYLGKKEALHLDGVETHLIGHLQTNKVKQIVGEVDMIESVDSLKLAREISKESVKKRIESNILVEVNIGKEASKSGIALETLEPFLQEISLLDGIKVKGLMTIPPIAAPQEVRKYFSLMYQSFIDIRAQKLDNIDMSVLSMGMSGDYESAILEGATIVRVGSAIFGTRKYS